MAALIEIKNDREVLQMKNQKKQKLFMSILAGFLALLMLLPIIANIFMIR